MLGLKDCKIYTMTQGVLEGSLVIKDGKIFDFARELDLSACQQVIDGRGRYLTPGLIDAHSHVGLTESGLGQEGEDSNELSRPITPACRALDGINMRDQAFEEYRSSGITSVGILPGSSNLIGGSGLVLKCKGSVVDEALVKEPLGMKLALGENPKMSHGSQGRSPLTRMGNAALLRQAFMQAQDYLQAMEEDSWQGRAKIDRQSQALVPVLKKEMPLIIHCHRADDIVTAIRICREFDVLYVLEHVTDGRLVKDLIKKEKVSCALGPTLYYGSKVENKDRDFRTAIEFDRLGIPFCFITDHPTIAGRNLILTASLAYQWGLSEERALQAVTLSAAEHLGLDHQLGSIDVGKDADLLLWSDHPLELTSFVDMTLIDGQVVYEREE